MNVNRVVAGVILALPLVLSLALSRQALSQEPASETSFASRLHRIAPQTPRELQELFTPTGQDLPLVSAHRGGARKGFPENCLATFEETLRHTFALLEVDPRYTKDGAIVLHHDATLERATTGRGRVADFTLAELKQLKLKDGEGNVTGFVMPTLDEALEWARGRTVLVLDQKDVPVAARVRKIEEHRAEAFTVLIVYSFKDAQTCHALNPNVMMEVMIPNLEQAARFGQLGVPWRNVLAFVGHDPPEEKALYEFVHRQGASCLVGTSRNLDREVLSARVPVIQQLEAGYRALLDRGADIIETDIPADLGQLLYGSSTGPVAQWECLHAPTALSSGWGAFDQL